LLRYAGRVPQRLPRYQGKQEQADDLAKLAKLLLAVGAEEPDAASTRKLSRVTHGDPVRLRGLPAVGKGTRSTMPGTDPLGALLAKERRR
jgi:hypothetical protein